MTGPDAPHVFGNSRRAGAAHRQWFVGHFVEPTSGLRTDAVEVKWCEHPAGERRSDWSVPEDVHSLSVLLRGDFEIRFDDRGYRLREEGDFVLWRPGVRHHWHAREASLVLTVRWPSRR